MFFPISDENPSQNKPLITFILIGLCIFFFILQYLSQMNIEIFLEFGFVPSNFFNTSPSLESYFPIISSMFLHGGLAHIAGNMLYLWIFGDNVEDAMGRTRFIIFYFCFSFSSSFILQSSLCIKKLFIFKLLLCFKCL